MPHGTANSASGLVAGLVHKKIMINDLEIDKYTYLRRFYSPVEHPWWTIAAEIVKS